MEILDNQKLQRRIVEEFELSNKKIDWEGFLRSETCESQVVIASRGKYKAKSRSCSLEIHENIRHLIVENHSQHNGANLLQTLRERPTTIKPRLIRRFLGCNIIVKEPFYL